MTIDWARLGPSMGRERVVALLEGPVRQLLADGATTRPVVEIEEIVGELDRLDRIANAKRDENVRLAKLRDEVTVALGVEDVDGSAGCMAMVYGGYRGRNPCSRKAKLRIPGVGLYCGQHAKEMIGSEVHKRVDAAEKERRARGELTEAERIIDEGEEVRVERHRAYYGWSR